MPTSAPAVKEKPARLARTAAGALALAAIALAWAPAQAEPGLRVLARATSDYVARGYTKSDGDAVLQGNADYLSGAGLYAGAWLSQLDFGGAELETIGYLGLRRPLGEAVRLDLSLSRYWYDARVFGRRAGYDELYVALHYGDRATLGFSHSPSPYGLEHPASNVQGELRHPLSDAAELSAAAGYEWAARAYDYDNLHWNAGLTWFLGRFAAIDLRYFGARELNAQPHANAPEGRIGDTAIDDRVVLSVSLGR